MVEHVFHGRIAFYCILELFDSGNMFGRTVAKDRFVGDLEMLFEEALVDLVTCGKPASVLVITGMVRHFNLPLHNARRLQYKL